MAAVLLCMLFLEGDKFLAKQTSTFCFLFGRASGWVGLSPSSRNGRATEFPELIKTESASHRCWTDEDRIAKLGNLSRSSVFGSLCTW